MAPLDPIASTAPVVEIAEPHQSTVTAILRAARQGVFTATEADMLIDRVRVHVTRSPIVLTLSVEDTPSP
jgi:hypothetical protein